MLGIPGWTRNLRGCPDCRYGTRVINLWDLLEEPRSYHFWHPTWRSLSISARVWSLTLQRRRAQSWYSSSIRLRSPVGGSDLSCKFWRFVSWTCAFSGTRRWMHETSRSPRMLRKVCCDRILAASSDVERVQCPVHHYTRAPVQRGSASVPLDAERRSVRHAHPPCAPLHPPTLAGRLPSRTASLLSSGSISHSAPIRPAHPSVQHVDACIYTGIRRGCYMLLPRSQSRGRSPCSRIIEFYAP